MNKTQLNKMRRYQNRRARRGGSILIVTAAGMIAFMGFCALAIDYGVLVSDKNRLQRACDAGALAGASQLPDKDKATELAQATAKLNGTIVRASDVTFEENDKIIRVGAVFTRDLWFAKVIRIPRATVSAYAKATGQSMTTPEVVPIGITANTYAAYKNDTLPHNIKWIDHAKESFGNDEMVFFDLRPQPAKSPKWFFEQLIGNDKQTVTIGADAGATSYQTSLNTSNPDKFFEEGMGIRFQRSSASPWLDTWTGNEFTSTGIRYNEILAGTHPPANPRIMHLIVTPETTESKKGTFDALVTDFAPVYVEKIYSESGDPGMTIRFLPKDQFGGGGNATLIE